MCAAVGCTWVGTVVGCPVDDRRRGALSVAGQCQTLAHVEGHVTRHLLEDGPHVDGQADILSDGTRGVGRHTGEHTSVCWLYEKKFVFDALK